MENYPFIRQQIGPKSLPHAVLAKWDAAALAEGFVPLPKRLLRCMNRIFTGDDAIERLMVVMAIVDYIRPNLTRGPSREFLAFIAGLSTDRLDSVLRELQKEHLVTISEKSAGELNVNIAGLLSRIDALTTGDSEPNKPPQKTAE